MYRAGGVYPKIFSGGLLSDNSQQIVVTAGTQAKEFHADFAKILGPPGDYVYRIDEPHIKAPYGSFLQAWHHNPMQFWQTQLNFALWCATGGCGVSYHDHVLASDAMMSSLFQFHVYYTTRKILAEMECPLPEDGAWEKRNNHYNQRAYE